VSTFAAVLAGWILVSLVAAAAWSLWRRREDRVHSRRSLLRELAGEIRRAARPGARRRPSSTPAGGLRTPEPHPRAEDAGRRN